ALSFSPKDEDGKYRLQGTKSGKNFEGRGQKPDGQWVSWSATYTQPVEKEEKKDKKEDASEPAWGDLVYPFSPYGRKEQPKAETVLFKNATVWTNEKDGILTNTDVLVKDGKIAAVGQKLPAPAGAKIVEAKDMHLTSGIIDEHTHIGITRGVNEGTQASSAEVRIGDVVDSEDINLYRQLSGGVTAAQQLHGSANPIGGQSSLIKFRWGMLPEDMKIKGADGFIKFALGENVKQSNWGDNQTTRFPQTRMGVEQVYMDYFTRAKEYGALKASGKPYRKDLDLEAVLEILNKERFITCHSYRQSEINMLMKVAEHFGFNVNTFTHILEGYKVADIMAKHGAGGSTFSDWWAYKFEVWEAIPYNGALMHEQGVVVAFNSDDAEMARRLNQEAAKAVKYGGVSEEEAWKFVTLNPAKLLHLDDRMGSIKTGKDADLVLWSNNPLSIDAVAMQTWIDGRKYFDREEDKTMREEIAKERNRLIQKMLEDKKKGGKTQPAMGRKKEHYHCDTIEEW
ncbi:MAG: amidohydrolase, partial [Saprospiraceae bacterium]|nr:amidohydrolase [Saprospiraceae bacterium]